MMKPIAAALLALAAAPAMAADYVVIEFHADTATPANTAWERIRDFCAIEKFAKVSCKITSGKGGLGSVRSLANGAAEEPMVARTARSYTYSQTVGGNKGIDYHGTLAVEPTGAGTSRIDYTLVYDQSLIAADKRQGFRAGFDRFQGFVDNLKAMAEGR